MEHTTVIFFVTMMGCTMKELDFSVLNSSHVVVWDWNVQHGEFVDTLHTN